MKLILFGLAFVAIAAGQQYLPPTVEEIVPVKPDNQYLAPVEVEQVQPEPESQYLPPIEAVEPIEQIAEDGYRYKTVKRIRYRTRRDVSELASAQYLPPSVEDSYGPPPSGPVNAPVEESAVLADDGYRYRTVKRIRYRYRRDVNELPSGQYLAPTQEDDSYSYPAPAPVAAPAPIVQAAPIAPIEVAAPVQISAPALIQQTAQLADDGYRYKTVRRIRYRHRRDVNELAAGQYLPPTQEDDSYSYPAPAPVAAPAPIVQAAPIAPIEVAAQISVPSPIQQTAELADDGYRYKTVRRIRYRHRRDVNELAAAKYLPPTQEVDSYSYPAPAPVAALAPIVQAAPIAPIELAAPVEIPAPVAIQPTAELADDGYRYKTVRRIRYRHRRDVNELAAGQYLPPTQEDDSYSYPAPAPVAALAPIVQAAPVPQYLPPSVEVAAVEISTPIQQSAELAEDGYRYKTVKKYKIKRH